MNSFGINLFTPIGPKDYINAQEFINNKLATVSNLKKIYYLAEIDLNLINCVYVDPEKFTSIRDVLDKSNVKPERYGWYYQQLCTLFFLSLIDTEERFTLMCASDIFFNNEINFFDESLPIITLGRSPYHAEFMFIFCRLFNLDHSSIFHNQKYSAISHHSVFEKNVVMQLLNEFGNTLEEQIQYIVNSINFKVKSGLSEYELYFNYMLLRNHHFKLRETIYIDCPDRTSGFVKVAPMVAEHWYMRGNPFNKFKFLLKSIVASLVYYLSKNGTTITKYSDIQRNYFMTAKNRKNIELVIIMLSSILRHIKA